MKEESKMKKFFLTFGQKSPARNGWIEMKADDYRQARKMAVAMYDRDWSKIYAEEDFNKEYFPAGKLGDLGI